MRSSLCLLALAAVSAVVCVSAQAPNPPPIWPVSFQARFGLSMTPLLHAPIVNSTSLFLYNLDPAVNGQLIDYPEFCPASPKLLVGGLNSGCQLLFLEAGIYVSQPSENIKCCQLFANVGPTPRNFTNGFTWQGVQVAYDYYGTARTSDYYTGGPAIAEFKYWTEVDTHHDVYFHDGAGANWAWDHLNVTTIDPSVFSLFADNATCAQSCSLLHSEGSASTEVIQAAAAQHGHIALALHHHALANQFDMESDYVAAIIEQQKIARESLGEQQESEEVALL